MLHLTGKMTAVNSKMTSWTAREGELLERIRILEDKRAQDIKELHAFKTQVSWAVCIHKKILTAAHDY